MAPLSEDERAAARERLLALPGGAAAEPRIASVEEGPTLADRIDLAWMLSIALVERAQGKGALPDLLGLERTALNALAERYFPRSELPDRDVERAEPPADQAALSLLMRWRGGGRAPESLWFADILARRAQETRHLWEDAGLPTRAALNELMTRRFPRLKAANSQNMRWKKFFYRQICSDSDFALCLSPTCDECPEREECFAPEDAA